MKRSVTPEWLSLVVLAALLTCIGLFTSYHLLIVLALPPVCIAMVTLFFAFEVPELTVTRAVKPALLEEGQSAEVRIQAINREGGWCHLSLAEQVDRESGWPPSATFTGPLGPGESTEIRYPLKVRRGIYELPPVELEVSDELGMRVARRSVDVPCHLTVWPRIERLRAAGVTRDSRFSQLRSGRAPAPVPGSGTEWLGVRGYSFGDPLRRINWRAWARTEQLFTNDFSSERSVDAWVVLDARSRIEIKLGESSLFERSVTASATLCRELLDEGNRVALLIYGGTIDFVPLGSGLRQLERIMTRLATAEPAAHVAFATYANLPTRLFRPQQNLYFVTPLAKDDAELIIALSGAGHHVVVLSPDPVSFEAETVRVDSAGEAAWRIVRLEREAAMLMLIRGGCRVIDWQLDEPLASSLARSVRGSP